MEELLRKSCPNCTVSSIKTYAQNVKGLAKVAGLKAVPTNAKWLTGKLLETIKGRPLTSTSGSPSRASRRWARTARRTRGGTTL